MWENKFDIMGTILFSGCNSNKRDFVKASILARIKFCLSIAADATNTTGKYDEDLYFDVTFVNPSLNYSDRKLSYRYAVLTIKGGNKVDNKDFWLTFFKELLADYGTDIYRMNIMLYFPKTEDNIILKKGKYDYKTFSAITLGRSEHDSATKFKQIEEIVVPPPRKEDDDDDHHW